MDNEELREIQEMLEKSQAIRKMISARDNRGIEVEGKEEEKVEEWVELMHCVGQMDQQKGKEKLWVELKRREKRKQWRIWYRNGIAAVVAIVLATMAWLKWQQMGIGSGSAEELLNEIKVPTLITLNDNRILSQETLNLQNAGEGYKVQAEEDVYAADSLKRRSPLATVIRYHQIVIPAGYTYKVELADGSRVILNAGSKMTFPEKFTDSLRMVEFVGEGYFDIKKSEVPFVVKMNQMQVRVYGTRFNLFYSEELALSEAVLVEGSIGMVTRNREVKIAPNQCVSYSLQDSTFCRMDVNPSTYITWLGVSFKYDKVKLSRIVYDIARWYGVEIQLAPQWRERRFSLEFNRSASLDWVMNVLELMINQSIKRENGVYYIE